MECKLTERMSKMNANQRILVVDDDRNICEIIRLYLEKEGFEVLIANDGQQALELFKEKTPSVVVLDVMMPKMDGFQVCREIRRVSSIPVIMLTAKGETFDKVLGLELGADDYMVKPFENKELVARIKAILRRYDPKDSTDKEIIYPNIVVNLTNYELKINGEAVDIPPKELELLYYLATNPNKVFTREQLLDDIWGYGTGSDSHTVEVHIGRLREKFKDNPDFEIVTMRGVGYKVVKR